MARLAPIGWIVCGLLGLAPDGAAPVVVRVPLNDRQEVEMGDLVGRLAEVGGVSVEIPKASIRLPMAGLGGPIARRALAETIGADVIAEVDGRELVLTVPPDRLDAGRKADWEARLRGLADRVAREAKRRDEYGLHALKSYRPNDPSRPTVCLIHGLNSTSSVFWHMIGPIEAAGYGVVVYDFPYNRDLDESTAIFRRDWAGFRERWGDRSRWGVVAHSMGGLLARAYVEDDGAYRKDVASLVLIAPVNGGSNLSGAQTLLQTLQGLKATSPDGAKGKVDRARDPIAHLGDGVGAAADDMRPGSAFLTALNAKARREGVPYHILAGDGGFLSAAARGQVDARLGLAGRPGLLGGIARIAATNLPAQLDEVTEGTGDGCVSVASTRLVGVADHVVLRANHLELIRAPLLYPDPGPIAAMPAVLGRLAKDLPVPEPALGPESGRQGLGRTP